MWHLFVFQNFPDPDPRKKLYFKFFPKKTNLKFVLPCNKNIPVPVYIDFVKNGYLLMQLYVYQCCGSGSAWRDADPDPGGKKA